MQKDSITKVFQVITRLKKEFNQKNSQKEEAHATEIVLKWDQGFHEQLTKMA